ncbi:ArsR/SmtB family transcription factor [Mariprofundus ferrooxydans]|uniref:Regulatory protein, ArsR n=1 Tax=Mariprofundus ferrooxydans PV-1 TaxID=314345 RepID=Q0F195_9PROT|nr:metalloregulator ArsR/SmtB family transcription factor [Mariprofundus ferrooxydans]EAU55296.1 regulatory protein, ArsR [Mariprofundus ferrooxydans PV-1]KON47191.1 ArsR family transcriptional regulator [Mariprofundus ferrooxydans]
MREAGSIVAMFKALGDPVRLRLFALITHHDELCVCHLTEALSLPQSTVSRQLGLLRHAGLVQARRDGKWIYYRAGENALPSLQAAIDACAPSALLAEDRNRLHQVLAPESASHCNTGDA